MKYKSTILLIVLCMLGGLFTSFKVNAQTSYSQNLKDAIKAFLVQKGDIQDGNGVQYNWERLNVQDPDATANENSWWDDFAAREKYYIYSYGVGYVYLNINKICYGDFILENVDDLISVTIVTNYFKSVKIKDCNVLRDVYLTIYYADDLAKISDTEVNISGCPDLYNVNISGADMKDVNITDCVMLSSFSSNESTLNNITIKGSPSFEYFSSQNDIRINKIQIEGSNSLKTFSLTVDYDEIANVGEINISNNQSTSFSFTTKNVKLPALPALPTLIRQLTIEYEGSNINGSVNFSQLSNLEYIDLSGSSLQKLPALPVSLKALMANDVQLNEQADLRYLSNLGFFQCSNSELQSVPQLPSSLKVLIYQGTTLNGPFNLSQVPGLKYLDLSECGLTSLPNLPNTLEMLRCEGNDLKELPTLPSSLEILNCTNNKIQKLDLSALSNLKLLSAGNNQISDIKFNRNAPLEEDIEYSYNDYYHFDYQTEDFSYNPFTHSLYEYNGVSENNLLFSKLHTLHGIDRLDRYYVFPQNYFDGGSIQAGEVIDLSAEKAIQDLSFEWYDVTKVFPLWENYSYYSDYMIEQGITGGTILDVTAEVTDNNDGKFNTSGQGKKILLCKMNIPLIPYQSTYYLANITDGETPPVLQFQTQIDGGSFTDIPNNTTTTLSSSNLNEEDPLIERAIALRVMPVISNTVTYDHWKIDYWYNGESDIQESGEIAKDIPFDFPYTPQGENLSVDYNGTFKIVALRLYENGSLKKTYSYAYEPYNHTIVIDDCPYLQYEESINSDKEYNDIGNNLTTTLKTGNKAYLRIKVLGGYLQPPTAETRVSDMNNNYLWEIEYTDEKGGTPIRSGRISLDKPFYFNGGSPHQEPGEYHYSVTRLFIYRNDRPIPNLYTISAPGPQSEYEFTANPYNHTIIIKDNGTPPPPKPEEPGPDPDPNPDTTPGIDIPSWGPICPDEVYVLLPYELKYTDYPMQYTIHFSEVAKAVGFTDQLVSRPLPETYITIPLPANVPPGIYKGTIRLTSPDSKLAIEDCPFEIKILTGTKILKQPELVRKNICEGDLFTLRVEAIGENLTYQWYKDDQIITGANEDTYEAVFSAETGGTYFVEVTGLCGIEKSDTVVVDGNPLLILMKWDDVMYIDNTSGRYVSFQWYKNGVPVEKYGKSIYYTETTGLNGTYYVVATTVDGIAIESCWKVFDTPVKSSSAQLYPNPVSRNETLTVKIETDGFTNNGKLDILDLGGRLVLSRQLTGNTTSVYVDLPAGSYVAKVQAPNGRITTQVLLVK